MVPFSGRCLLVFPERGGINLVKKIEMPAKELSRIVTRLSITTKSRTTHPGFTATEFDCIGTMVRMRTCDGETETICVTDQSSKSDWKFSVYTESLSSRMAAIVGACGDQVSVAITERNGGIRITSGKTNYDLGVLSDSVPSLDVSAKELSSVEVESGPFLSALDRAKGCTRRSETEFTHGMVTAGVMFEFGEDSLTLFCTDTVQAAIVPVGGVVKTVSAVPGSAGAQAIAPRAFAEACSSSLSGLESSVSVRSFGVILPGGRPDVRFLDFRHGGDTIRTRLFDGRYPELRGIGPKSGSKFLLKRSEFRAALRQVMVDEGGGSVSFSFEGDELHLSSKSGESRSECPCLSEFESVHSFKIDPQRVSDYLAKFAGDEVDILFGSGNAVRFTDPAYEGYQFIVMKMGK